jgi:hypothetical protein
MTQTLSANINNDISGVAFNDIYLDASGNISISTDQQALLEECAQVARTLLGELVFNTSLGIPYFETVWTGVPNTAQFLAALRTSFLNVNGVLEIVSLTAIQGTNSSFTPSLNDTLTYTAVIRTIFGTGVLNG